MHGHMNVKFRFAYRPKNIHTYLGVIFTVLSEHVSRLCPRMALFQFPRKEGTMGRLNYSKCDTSSSECYTTVKLKPAVTAVGSPGKIWNEHHDEALQFKDCIQHHKELWRSCGRNSSSEQIQT